MDNTAQIVLEKTEYKTDALNQHVPVDSDFRTLLCEKKNVKRSEWLTAGQMGFRASWCVSIWPDEYQGETVAIVDGVRYSIYRTYQVSTEKLELYLGQKAGT